MSKKELRSKRRKAAQRRSACPHPEKTAFRDESTALSAMTRYGLKPGDGWGFYTCACGSVHLTSNGRGLVQIEYGKEMTA